MKLSIVTISFNAENCIEKTLLSVLNQTLPVYEYIMIDGASKDKTNDIICSYESEFVKKGIRFIHVSEPDKGISDAFNKGIQKATGDLIGLINADDELMPEACQMLEQFAARFPADIYYGNCWWVDDAKGMEYIKRPKHDLDDLLYNMILIHSSTFVTRQTYEECGLFNLEYRYCMDKEFLYRCYIADKKFVYIDAELTKFKAGGISDIHIGAVYKEGSRMALAYGEPFVRVKAIEVKKLIKGKLVRIIKKLPMYQWIKKSRKL